jgi:hypothetical protein
MSNEARNLPAHNLEYNNAITRLYSEELQQLQSMLAEIDFKLEDLAILAPCQNKVTAVLDAVTAFKQAVASHQSIDLTFKTYLESRLNSIEKNAETLEQKLKGLVRPDGGSFGETGFSYDYGKADAVIDAVGLLRKSGMKLPEVKQPEGLRLFYAMPRENYAQLPKKLKVLYELEFDLADIENLEDISGALNSLQTTNLDISGFEKNGSLAVKALANALQENEDVLPQSHSLSTLLQEELAGTLEVLKAIRFEYFAKNTDDNSSTLLVDQTSVYGRCSDAGKTKLKAIAAKLAEKENNAIAGVAAHALLKMQAAKTGVQDGAYLYPAWQARIKVIREEKGKLTCLHGNEKTAASTLAINSALESIETVEKTFDELEEDTLAKEIQAVWRKSITSAAKAHQKLSTSFKDFGARAAIATSWVQADAAYHEKPAKDDAEKPETFTVEDWQKINQAADAKLTGLSVESQVVLAEYEGGNLGFFEKAYNELVKKTKQLGIVNEQLQQALSKLKTLLDELPNPVTAQDNADVIILEAIRRQLQLCEHISKQDNKVAAAYQATDQAFSDMQEKIMAASDELLTAYPEISTKLIDEHRETLINNKRQFRLAQVMFGIVVIAGIIGILDYALDFIDGNSSNEELANALFRDNAQAVTSASNATSLTAYDTLNTPSLCVGEESVESVLRITAR